ncbi:MAG TPA: glycosyltransferase family 9 protein [Gaiellales bacterium]|nr:glycosyltransferase family 9 protein [Gaiellales bacterium]
MSGRLLVLRALGLGDLLTGVPALRGLRRAFPHHRIELAAPAPLTPLALYTGAVDAVVDAAGLGPLPVGVAGADVAVNLHGRGPQSHRRLLERAPGALIAFAHPDVPESCNGPAWQADEHEVARWCRLLGECGIPADPADLRLPGPLGWRERDVTVIHPGAASGARRWPPDRWARVAAAEWRRGRRVVLTGSSAERPLCTSIARAACLPEEAIGAGETGLDELLRLVASAGRVACADTGVAHLATALGTPSVVLFGPTPPSLWGPPPGGRHVVLWHGTRGDPHADDPDPGLLAISVDEVLDALARLDGVSPKLAAPEGV